MIGKTPAEGPLVLLRSSPGLREVTRLLDFLLPPACVACGGRLPPSDPGTAHHRLVCPTCSTRLRTPPEPRCFRCGSPRGTGLPQERPCPECHEWPTALTLARSAVVLTSPADRLIYALKYGGWYRLGREMADRMVDDVNRTDLSIDSDTSIVPIPTTPGRLRKRGYNQARLLADRVAERTGGTLCDVMERRAEGGSQVALQPRERQANVHGAFTLRSTGVEVVRDQHVVLVDDVLTTGATAAAAASVLQRGGARTVRLLTFARSLPGSE